MSNVYNVISKDPALRKKDMPGELDKLAVRLVMSGKLRISAEDRCNFVHFTVTKNRVKMMFSKRELTDKRLVPKTKAKIADALREDSSKENVEREYRSLLEKIEKTLGVLKSHEIMIARALVQSAHPVVITLLLLEEIEIFVSYSYSISELLYVSDQKSAGMNSGMQSISHTGDIAIFVSCCGDPFIPKDQIRHVYDGKAALTRLMIIAAQEIGHYADIIRDKHGNIIDRHASNIYVTQAKTKTSKARKLDIKRVTTLKNSLSALKIHRLKKAEKALRFYRKHNFRKLLRAYLRCKIFFLKRYFKKRCEDKGFGYFNTINCKDYFAETLITALDDMHFNIHPNIPAYQRDNQNAEEAVFCVEALARVPQQEVKWGIVFTKKTIPNLYKIYYEDVISTCTEEVKRLLEKN